MAYRESDQNTCTGQIFCVPLHRNSVKRRTKHMEWLTNKVSKFENVKYFASLVKNGCHFAVVNVHNFGCRDGVFDHLRKKPEDIKLTVAHMDRDMRNGMWCSLMICRDQEEYDRYMQDKEWDGVEDLWEEKEEITRTANTIAQV